VQNLEDTVLRRMKTLTNNRVNRQPSLYEYAILAMKIRLVDDYTIHYPIAVCEPLNADFDGDTVSIQLVPEEIADDIYRKMSPRYVTFYKKNQKPIPSINHETLNGLAVATEWTPEDPEELKNPRHTFEDYTSLLKAVEIDKSIKIGTPIRFSGKAGDVEFKDKITTYGRVRISKIIGKDIDDLEFTKNSEKDKYSPYTRFNAKAAVKLSAYLCDFPEDGVEKRHELQKFCLRAVTLAGVVTFDWKTLFVDCMSSESYKELCKIADSTELTDQQKLCLLTDKYEKYEKEVEESFSEDLKDELNRAGRVKISSISSLNMPQLIISGINEKPVITRGNLLAGYGEKDMIYHAIENRSLQDIKNSGVHNKCPEFYWRITLKRQLNCWK